MKFAFAFSCFVACCVGTANAESIATLTGAEGPVLVNTGEGFSSVQGQEPTALKIGDTILVKEQGFATLSFAQCAVTLSQPTFFTVTETPPCAVKGNMPVQGVVIAPAMDDAAADPLLPVVKAGVVGGIVIGAGVVLVTGLTDNDNENDPVSPP